MKKLSALIISLLIATMGFAQTQQGYVKTKGRMVNGKLVPGQGLKGATVSIKGRTAILVNKDDGSFSFPVPEVQFRVDSVRKNGYQLVDMDALSKTYEHSANPIYLVMETPDQQLQDQLTAERKIRRTLTNQLHQREDEIEALKEQQSISDEEYQHALQKLYEETDQNELLVKDMVNRYSTIDYDQLSEFDQKISEFILNGELVKADSMLRTKGDINERIEQYRKHEAINSKEKEELSRRQASLKQSEIAVQRECDDLANDCYRKFEICKIRHENDSAAYYLELRASLDSSNVIQLIEAGDFILDYLADFQRALKHHKNALKQSVSQYGEKSEYTILCYNALGNTYKDKCQYNEALECYFKAYNIAETIHGDIHYNIASSCNNIGSTYKNLGEYDKAFEFSTRALNLLTTLLGENHPDVAVCHCQLSTIYEETGDFDKALEHLNKALSIRQSTLGENHPDMALTYNNLGLLFDDIGNSEKALEYYNKALSISEIFYGDSHPNTATIYDNIGAIHSSLAEYEAAESFLTKALKIRIEYFGEKTPHVATSYNNIAFLYDIEGNKTEAILYYKKALSIFIDVFGKTHPDVAILCNNIGSVYYDINDNEMALEYFNSGLTIAQSVFEENHPIIATSYIGIGAVFVNKGDYKTALEYSLKALQIQITNYGEDNSNLAINYGNIGTMYYN